MKRMTLQTALVALIPALFCGCEVNPQAPQKTDDGLTRVISKQVDEVYVVRGRTLAPYHRVILDTVEIAFKPDWQQRHPEVSADQVVRIRSQGAQVFYDIFRSALSKNGGYGLTNQPAPDVLRVSATIADLDVAASPADKTGNQRMYVVSPSDLTLHMELRDSQSGAIIARAIDREKGRTFGNLQVADAVSNSTEARRALEMWAGLLRDALDAARSAPAPSN